MDEKTFLVGNKETCISVVYMLEEARYTVKDYENMSTCFRVMIHSCTFYMSNLLASKHINSNYSIKCNNCSCILDCDVQTDLNSDFSLVMR